MKNAIIIIIAFLAILISVFFVVYSQIQANLAEENAQRMEAQFQDAQEKVQLALKDAEEKHIENQQLRVALEECESR